MPTIVDFVERYENVLGEQEERKERVKDLFEELKGLGLPVKGIKKIITDGKKDPNKLEKDRKELIDAGTLMDTPVYAEEVLPDDTNRYDNSKVEITAQHTDEIRRLAEEIKEDGKDLREIMKEATSEGFPGALLPRLVEARRDPKTYYETTGLMELCLNAMGIKNDVQ